MTASRATEASLAVGRPNHCCQPPKGSARVIHANAVKPKIINTRRSALRQGPTSGSVTSSSRGTARVTHNQASGSRMLTTGKPHDIHWLKLMTCPVFSSSTCTRIRLGGVPIGVPSPPMLQDHANPSSNGGASSERFEQEAKTASATGMSINTDAVLEIHILSSAPASIKPSTNCFGRCPPTTLTTVRAIL